MKKVTNKMGLTIEYSSMIISQRKKDKVEIIQYKIIKKNEKYILYYKNITENLKKIITKSKYLYPVEKMYTTLCIDSLKQIERNGIIY